MPGSPLHVFTECFVILDINLLIVICGNFSHYAKLAFVSAEGFIVLNINILIVICGSLSHYARYAFVFPRTLIFAIISKSCSQVIQAINLLGWLLS